MKEKHFIAKKWAFLIIFISVIISILSAFSAVNFFIVQEVQCYRNQELAAHLCQQYDQFKGLSLFFTDFTNQPLIQQNLYDQENNNFYQVVKIEKRLPHQLILYLDKDEVSYRLILPDNHYYLINQQSLVKKNDPNIQVKSIQIDSSDQLIEENTAHKKQVSSSQHLYFIKLLKNLKKIQYRQIKYKSQSRIEVILDEHLIALFDQTTSIALSVRKLELILKHLDLKTIDQSIKEIDLRFNYPVLRTKESII